MEEDLKSKPQSYWRERLTPEQYHVMREQATERPYMGEYCDIKEVGTYRCAACEQELFRSESKFESGTGWPSFFGPVSDDVIERHEDKSYGMVRTEVTCGRCGSHLGHVFPDGPPPSGERYCINSIALKLNQ